MTIANGDSFPLDCSMLRMVLSVPGAYLLHMLISLVVCIVNANFIYMNSCF